MRPPPLLCLPLKLQTTLGTSARLSRTEPQNKGDTKHNRPCGHGIMNRDWWCIYYEVLPLDLPSTRETTSRVIRSQKKSSEKGSHLTPTPINTNVHLFANNTLISSAIIFHAPFARTARPPIKPFFGNWGGRPAKCNL